MDSTDFKVFMNAQVKEMQAYIDSNGGTDLDQKLSHEWARTRSETFRRRWDSSKLEPDLSVLGHEFPCGSKDQSSSRPV